jgi:Protein of unknown function (DUF2842)
MDWPIALWMNIRQRKLIGTFLTVGYLIAYSLVAMALGGKYIIGRGMPVELVFYAIAGFAWIPGAMMLIRWMTKV